jgi:hypothetical protein
VARRKTTTTKRKTASKPRKTAAAPCATEGCRHSASETHEGAHGPVELCRRCSEFARKSLTAERNRVDGLDVAATPFERASARLMLRRVERAHAALR